MDSFDSAPISVVMPSHNAAPFVEEAVESVLGRTYPRVKLFVGGDGSLEEASGILLQNCAGPFAMRNGALARAEGNLIAFLDADDTWHPDTRRQMHAGLEAEFADVAGIQACWQRSRIRQSAERRAGYSTASNRHHVDGHDCSFA